MSDSLNQNPTNNSPSYKFNEAPEERLKLSQYISNLHLNSQHDLKTSILNFSHKSIEEIDLLFPNDPLKYMELLGDSNYISSLRNIVQFRNLHTLSLIDNEIEGLENIYYLTPLKDLRCLNLQGNIITENPEFVNIVLVILPNLNVLNGEVITEERRKEIPEQIKENFISLEKLIENQIQITKIETLINRLKVHQDLYCKDFRFRLNHVSYTIDKFLQIYKFSDYIDEVYKNHLRKKLLKELKVDQSQAFIK